MQASRDGVTNVGLKRDRTLSFVSGVSRQGNVTADNEVALCATWS